MRANYFNDFECYARDLCGNKISMVDGFLFFRDVKIVGDYCCVGKDFMHPSHEFMPCMKIFSLKGYYNIRIKLHHISSEFNGVGNYKLIENETVLINENINLGEIHCYDIKIYRDHDFSIEFLYASTSISYAALRCIIEIEEIEEIEKCGTSIFVTDFEVQHWVPKISNACEKYKLEAKDYGSEYKY